MLAFCHIEPVVFIEQVCAACNLVTVSRTEHQYCCRYTGVAVTLALNS